MTPLAISFETEAPMPLNPRPLHDEHAPPVESDGPTDAGRDEAPLVSIADFSHLYVKVAVAAFIGYTLAKLIHRRG